MKLSSRTAPHIRGGRSNRTVMLDMIVTLAAVYFMAWYYYGRRALILGAVSVAVCLAADHACTLLRGRKPQLLDLSAVVTGMLIPLMMPASIPYRVPVVAGLFAICIVKQAFGGLGNNIFNPAAAGVAFAIVCWGGTMFAYPTPFTPLETVGNVSALLTSGPAYTLYVGGVPRLDAGTLLQGVIAGPMGTTNVLVIAACGLYLAARRTIHFLQPLLMLGTVALCSLLFPRGMSEGLTSVVNELFFTPVVFFGVFLFTDPVTTPIRGVAKGLYAVFSGILCVLLTRFGGYEMMFPFALLLMNAFVPLFDLAAEAYCTRERRRAYEKAGEHASNDFGPDDDEAAPEDQG